MLIPARWQRWLLARELVMAPPTDSPHDASDSLAPRAYARTGVSFAPDWSTAAGDAIDDVIACTSGAPDLLVAFITSAWSDHYEDILPRLRKETGCGALIGCSASGVISGATCHESAPGISLMAMWLPGATLTPLHITQTPQSWPWPREKDQVNGIILLSDPYRVDAQNALIGLRDSCPGIPMIGALASTSRADRRAWVFLNDDIHAEGAVALTLEGPYDLLVRVSQGGTPIGEMWTMTSVDHNRIVTISNRPAVDVMRDTLNLPENRELGLHDLMIGLPMDEYQDVFSREDFVARGIIGTDDYGAILVGGIPRQGQSVQFLKRNAKLASADLEERLRFFHELGRPLIGGILSSCKGRGTAMFGRNDHDAYSVSRALPDLPVAGLYSLGELAPVRGVPAYNAFAAALGVVVER